jgi:RHS repeat-associated protein
VALGTLPDNSSGNLDYGWLGQHQRGLEHQTGLTPVIEMGARPYVPGVGRFLAVDALEGGCANDYTYVHGDPINSLDVAGQSACYSHSVRRHGVRATIKVEHRAYGRIRISFRLRVERWADQQRTLGVQVALRGIGRPNAFSQDKKSRMGFGVNYTAHTKIDVESGSSVTAYGFAHIAGWFGIGNTTVHAFYRCIAI